MSQEQIQELSSKIKSAREAYYNLSPKISDQEFDALIDALKALDPNHEQIKSVGAESPKISIWEKVKHEIPMGSLNKANSEKEFEEWASGTGETDFFVTHKIDGSSMELVYKSGKLIRCCSRGDGITGEDVTTNIMQVPSIPKELTDPIDVIIRGEIVMSKTIFQTLYADIYANPRNTAAGKVRDKKRGGTDCQNLWFIAYWMIGDKIINGIPTTNHMMTVMGWLSHQGFQVPHCHIYGDLKAVYDFYENTKKTRNDIEYEIDGIVISVNDLHKLEELGELSMRPKGQIAWKFDPAMGVTTMLDVKWQVGNSGNGRITPVASITPVNIGGVTITSVSLHNLALFRDLRLFKGCRVLISRRNDCIPYVEKNLSIEDA